MHIFFIKKSKNTAAIHKAMSFKQQLDLSLTVWPVQVQLMSSSMTWREKKSEEKITQRRLVPSLTQKKEN